MVYYDGLRYDFFGCRLHFGLLKLKITVNHMKKYEKIQFMRII